MKAVKEILEGEVNLTPITGAMSSSLHESSAEKFGRKDRLILSDACIRSAEGLHQVYERIPLSEGRIYFSACDSGRGSDDDTSGIEHHLKKQGRKLDAFGYATTPNTFDIIHKVHEDEEMKKARAAFTDDVNKVAGRVKSGDSFVDRGYRNRMLEWILFPFLKVLNRRTGYFFLQNDLYTDDNCTGCGICSAMCLSRKIKMKNGQPIWQKDVDCDYCFACLQLCPANAVQVRNTKTPKLERIFCKGTDWKEIAAQKQG